MERKRRLFSSGGPGCPSGRPAVTCSGREGALTSKGTVIRGPPGNGQYLGLTSLTSQLTPLLDPAHKSGSYESLPGCLYVRRQVFRSASNQPYRGMPSAHTPVGPPSSLLHAPANTRSLPHTTVKDGPHTKTESIREHFEAAPLCFYLSVMLVQYLWSI